ncbi:putative type IV phospholipid-transporting ATPase [Triangularia verruculosa]|uniref:Phospholipid-transporting ATPase n=1 Tax=Triangularia verruculosa TaxID=2587418 RepID=A0AAN7AU89_9PEZI|nr:putative type IV phospholipid-transporting ATPase [Triangularia verruculosa]
MFNRDFRTEVHSQHPHHPARAGGFATTPSALDYFGGMAPGSHNDAAEALRTRLEQIELQSSQPTPTSPVPQITLPESGEPSRSGTNTPTRPCLSSPPTLAGVPRARHSLDSAQASRRPPPPLRVGTGLYKIESSQQLGPSPTQIAQESSTLSPQHQPPGRVSTSSQNAYRPAVTRIEESRISLTRPRQTFDERRNIDVQQLASNTMAPATSATPITPLDDDEDRTSYTNIPRDWLTRQKVRHRQLTRKHWYNFKKKTTPLYKKYILEGLLRQKPIPPSRDGRHIQLAPGRARRKPFKDERTGKPYVSNAIRSSRYTIWSFLPKQLFFQFKKLANFYFLVIGILQMVPGLSTTGTYTTIGPLLAFVALSMAKEGWDDYRRYKLDVKENRSGAWVLDPDAGKGRGNKKGKLGGLISVKREKSKGANGEGEMHILELKGTESEAGAVEKPSQWVRAEWQDIRVGDVIKLERDDPVPADIVLLHAMNENGIAYIETMALDGETNLKSKRASPLLAKHCASVTSMAAVEAEVVSEDPNLDLYNYEGKVTVDGETRPLTLNEVVYRGSTLRNTKKAVGLVINTGEECKIRMNANKNVRAKAPKMQRSLNRIVLLLVVFVFVLAGGLTAGYTRWRRKEEWRAFYLSGESVQLTHVFISMLIALNTLIPLSMYVSLEIVKLGQLLLLHDVEMYDDVNDIPAKFNTTTILEDLGCVGYVFSDKTGTLTENLMQFRKMSVAGTAWLHDVDVSYVAPEGGRPSTSGRPSMSQRPSLSGWKSSARPTNAQPELRTDEMTDYIQKKPNTPFSRQARQFLLCLALCHTCLPEEDENGKIDYQAASPDELALVRAAAQLGYTVVKRTTESVTVRMEHGASPDTEETYQILDVIEFSSKRKRMSIVLRMPDGRICIFTKGADSVILPRLKQKSLAMQTASAVERRASMRKSVEQEKAFQRRASLQTPAAQRRSMDLMRRSLALDRGSSWRKSMVSEGLDNWLARREADGLDAPGNEEAYQTPRQSMARNRSLELARLAAFDPLDGMVDEQLAVNEGAVFERCFQHIDDFATEGLRTLMYSYRYLEEEEYKTWKSIYLEATTSLVNRQERIENAAEIIEQDYELAGATAIEDKLQQGVPETIDQLRRANIKVWMLTGDKRETAINIAHSARICKPFSEVYILDVSHGDLQDRINATLTDVSRGMAPHSVVVIDGQTLTVVDEDPTLRLLFFDLVARVDSVICCRASPSQKANLVKCIRRQVPSAVTLAIGDGANDVAMLQCAHLGIGINGREGTQAARISDYSIGQFRFLSRLLFVHGRWCYARTGNYILATFWKEIVFYLIQAQYQHYNGYTGTSIFESTSLAVFNTIFTSLCVIIPGILETDLSAETLLAVPELYSFGQKSQGFNFKLWLYWMVLGVTESVMIYNCVYYLYALAPNPVETDLYTVGTLAFSLAVVFINLKLFLRVRNRNVIIFFGLLLSLFGWWLWNILLAVIYKPSIGPYSVGDSFLERYGKEKYWWIIHFLALSALCVFELGVAAVRRTFWPTDQDLAQEMEAMEGVMEVLGMHAHQLEKGEGGPSTVGVGVGGAEMDDGAGRKPGLSDVASLKTVTSASSPGPGPESSGGGGGGLTPGWSARNHNGGRPGQVRRMSSAEFGGRTSMSRLSRQFTPPAEEERENPIDEYMDARLNKNNSSNNIQGAK